MNSTIMFGFGEDSVATAPTSITFRFTRATTRARRAGFTLIELLVVIAILSLIVSLVLVGVGRATQSSRATMCRGNLRTIGIAANTYSESNKGRLPSPRTDTPAGWTGLKIDPTDSTSSVREDAANKYTGWVRTDLTEPGAIKSSGFNKYETPIALQKGSLYDYIGSETAYKSPQDPTQRVRSYSLNAFVGVMYCDDFYRMPGNISTKPYIFDTRTVSRIPKPSETLLAIPEWDQSQGILGWNMGGFMGNPEVTVVTNGTAPVTYSNAKWYDVPAVWNPGSINMAHVDGSVDSYEIQSPDMKAGELQKKWTSGAGYVDSDGDTYVDLNNIKKMLLPGKIK
jgi:prepilin-type N-terminal cleavage/methylation domain-containing protein